MPPLNVNAFFKILPTGLAVLGAIIHHIYYENYEEVGEFHFGEEGIFISDFKQGKERLIPISELSKILICYHGFYGEERNTYSSNWSVDFGDNNFIQIETVTERLRFCFYGNNGGDAKHIHEWSVYYSSYSVDMKPSRYIRHPRFIRSLFDKPLA